MPFTVFFVRRLHVDEEITVFYFLSFFSYFTKAIWLTLLNKITSCVLKREIISYKLTSVEKNARFRHYAFAHFQIYSLYSFIDVKWLKTDHSNFLWSIVGEWRILRCTTFDNENVNTTLWIDQTRPVIIDGVKIREISKNVYNLTNLQLHDTASYYCKACGSFKNLLRVNVKKGERFNYCKKNYSFTILLLTMGSSQYFPPSS